jgi:hypothetical protein
MSDPQYDAYRDAQSLRETIDPEWEYPDSDEVHRCDGCNGVFDDDRLDVCERCQDTYCDRCRVEDLCRGCRDDLRHGEYSGGYLREV